MKHSKSNLANTALPANLCRCSGREPQRAKQAMSRCMSEAFSTQDTESWMLQALRLRRLKAVPACNRVMHGPRSNATDLDTMMQFNLVADSIIDPFPQGISSHWYKKFNCPGKSWHNSPCLVQLRVCTRACWCSRAVTTTADFQDIPTIVELRGSPQIGCDGHFDRPSSSARLFLPEDHHQPPYKPSPSRGATQFRFRGPPSAR